MKNCQPKSMALGLVSEKGSSRVFLLRRKTEEFDWWELPGGKIKSGEKPEEALARELQEEMGVGVVVGRLAMQGSFMHDRNYYEARVYRATIVRGRPQVCELYVHHEVGEFDLGAYRVASAGFSRFLEHVTDQIQNNEVQL